MTQTLVGPILGAVSSLPATGSDGSGTGNADNLYTFAIDDLNFMVAPTDDNPYQRATAQFRKQQFDSAAEVGDQSLDGYWLRGQFSFHHGAGIKFYESLSGDATANRFYRSEGLNPWTPGALTLRPKLYAVSGGTGSAALDAAGGKVSGTPYAYAVTAANTVLRVNLSVAGTCTFTGTATSIAASDTNVYITAGTKIQKCAMGANAFSDLITQGDGRTFVKVAWAKGRLFMVDTAGYWYAKADGVATVASADSFWNSGITSAAGDWSVSDSPSAVFMAKGSSIYALSLATDGSVPTLTAPVVAAQLPPGESVRAIAFSLGWLVVATSAGVRVASVGDGGALSMGPVLVDFTDSTCREIALWGNQAYVTGSTSDGECCFALDLTEVLDTNVVAYSKRSTFTGTSTATGSVMYGTQLLTFGGEGLKLEAEDLTGASGYLTTGFIRFGTMEPKAFQSVRVKAEGTEGHITISVVRKGGGESSLTTLDVSVATDIDVSVNLPAPEEYVGLKFTLAPGAGGTGPTLLGYQLRALPAPSRRQRMISIPLKCYDKETAANGTIVDGGPGSAFARLAALENMEKSAGIVLFTDYRTGESAQCFIEEISFVNKTGPSTTNSGFGGIVTVTLRKVS